MKHIYLFLFLIFSHQLSAQWSQVGADLASAGNGNPISLQFNPSTNEPYVAYPNSATNTFKIQKFICTAATDTDTRTECNSYTWIDGINYTSSNNSATFNIANGAANGCDSLVTLDLTIINVSDLTTTTSGITISANNTGATYQWLDCDNNYAIISGENGQSYIAISNGNYAVELAENSCVDTTNCVAITSVGIIESDFGNVLVVYPNPTNGNLSIDLGAIYETSDISITDIYGKLIDSKTMTQSQFLNLSIEEPAGIYIVSILAGDKKAVIRLIKK
ncbi:MAG: T9SS type A sorting domain-containing protein [Crocinitomicaceae bacterium]|nr:T9SS type A sorting domain-containing protein [Crocinitomicaceae bacterium]